MLSCPMTVVDGTALRDVDDASVMVKLDPQCSKDPLKTCRTKPGNVSRTLRLTSTLSQGVEFDGDVGDQADVRRVVKASDGVYVQLRIGRITSDKLTVSAARLELDSTIVASAAARIFQLPQPRVALELVGHGKIDFVPTQPRRRRHDGRGEPDRAVRPAPGRGRVQRAHRGRDHPAARRGRRRKGGLAEFDRVELRVSHVIDETRYVVSTTAPAKPGLLAAQWSAIVDGSWLRLFGNVGLNL